MAKRTYRSVSASRQRGISFIGLLFVAIVLACVAVVVAQVIPTLIEYQAIGKAASGIASTVAKSPTKASTGSPRCRTSPTASTGWSFSSG